jgi:hypothetical protein
LKKVKGYKREETGYSWIIFLCLYRLICLSLSVYYAEWYESLHGK